MTRIAKGVDDLRTDLATARAETRPDGRDQIRRLRLPMFLHCPDSSNRGAPDGPAPAGVNSSHGAAPTVAD